MDVLVSARTGLIFFSNIQDPNVIWYNFMSLPGAGKRRSFPEEKGVPSDGENVVGKAVQLFAHCQGLSK